MLMIKISGLEQMTVLVQQRNILLDGSAGEVKLYHYGSQKLATKSTGVSVTGEVAATSLDISGDVM